MISRGRGEYIVVLNASFSVRDAGCCWITNASPRSRRAAAGSAVVYEIGGNAQRAVSVVSRMLPWQMSSRTRRKRRKRTWSQTLLTSSLPPLVAVAVAAVACWSVPAAHPARVRR